VAFLWIIWDSEDDPLGNAQHISEHGLTTSEVEAVLNDPDSADASDSSGLPCVFGFTPAGEHIIVIFESIDEDSIYPVTAYHVPAP
jgi:uncharacterized DUF497 family protein